MRKCEDVYQEPIIMEMPGCVARIYRPILTENERAKRMKAIHDAAEKVLKAAMKAERSRNER